MVRDVGEGSIYEDLDEIFDRLSACMTELQEKIAELSTARGIDNDESEP